jgi:hypothetical protein
MLRPSDNGAVKNYETAASKSMAPFSSENFLRFASTWMKFSILLIYRNNYIFEIANW